MIKQLSILMLFINLKACEILVPGYINIEIINRNSLEIQKLKKDAESMIQEIEAETLSLKDSLDKIKESYKKGEYIPALYDGDVKDLEDKINNNNLTVISHHLIADSLAEERIMPYLEEVAKEEKLSCLLPIDSCYIIHPRYDFTYKVINKMNTVYLEKEQNNE